MIKSMTGFGRHETITEDYRISVEMKAVNHRYLDLSIKMPKRFNCFESAIRNLLKGSISRGKVDIFINYEDHRENQLNVRYNEKLAREYMTSFQKMADQFLLADNITIMDLARCPEVLSMEQKPEDDEQIWNILSEEILAATDQFVASRRGEGEHLKEDLLIKLDFMQEQVSRIEERAPALLVEYRKRLEAKVKELLEGSAIDESRIATEVTIYADKICVDEETVRLKSHMEQTRTKLLSGGNVGRELDFIAQEMNREANTILSKANDISISEYAITLKTEIEKIREQIQNIE